VTKGEKGGAVVASKEGKEVRQPKSKRLLGLEEEATEGDHENPTCKKKEGRGPRKERTAKNI